MRRPLLYLHIALNFFMCCTPGMSAPPAWWTAGNPPVIDPAATPNSRGPANIGQAKWMAKNALEALRAVSPATAEAVESELVSDPEADPPENKPIKTWAAPTTPEEQAAQRAPLLIGQLKAISAPFYNHLNALNPTWLQNELALNQTAVSGSHFPWTVETTDDANKAIATIGQLKAVFSLRFETLLVDSDGDGLPDEWEYLHFASLTYGASDDPDGDGLTNAQEYSIGTNPANFGADADSDNLPDDWEIYWFGHPNHSGSDDPDGDGVPNTLDVRPNDPLIGQLTISIVNPLNGSNH